MALPKGRLTIRRAGGRKARLWEWTDSNNPTVKRLEAAYEAGLAAIDRAEIVNAERLAKPDPRFTPEGSTAHFQEFVLKELVPDLHRGSVAIKKARAELTERKSKLHLSPSDKTDLVAGMLRAEMRRWFISKPDRDDWLTANISSLDPEMARALVELPPVITGIALSHREMIEEQAMRDQFGDEIDAVKELEAAIVAAETVVLGAQDEVRIEAGWIGTEGLADFNKRAAPIEAKQNVPWLRKPPGGDELYVVDVERKVMRPPTAEELATGIEAATLDEFNRRNAA
jgi:hypothetical protein